METAYGAELGRKSSEMLVVPASEWEYKGMITPEFTLYIVIWLPENPKALYKHGSSSVTHIRTTWRSRPSFPLGIWGAPWIGYEHIHRVCICRLWHYVTVPSLSTEAQRLWHRQCFWSHSSAGRAFHLCLQMKIWRHGTAPVPMKSLVPACLSAGAGGDRSLLLQTWGIR